MAKKTNKWFKAGIIKRLSVSVEEDYVVIASDKCDLWILDREAAKKLATDISTAFKIEGVGKILKEFNQELRKKVHYTYRRIND